MTAAKVNNASQLMVATDNRHMIRYPIMQYETNHKPALKTYTVNLRRIQYEQVEVKAVDEQTACLLAKDAPTGLYLNDRVEALSVEEKQSSHIGERRWR